MDRGLFPSGYKDLSGEPGWAINNKAIELAQLGEFENAYHLLKLAEKAGYSGKELQENIRYIRGRVGNPSAIASIDAILAAETAEKIVSTRNQREFQDRATHSIHHEYPMPEGFEYLRGQSAAEVMRVAKAQFVRRNYTGALHLSIVAEKIGYELTEQDSERYEGYDQMSSFFQHFAGKDAGLKIRGLFETAAEQVEALSEDVFPVVQRPGEHDVFMIAQQDKRGRWKNSPEGYDWPGSYIWRG